MAEGRPLQGDSVTENWQDYVEERLETSTNLPEQAQAAEELEQAEQDLNKAEQGELTPQRQAPRMAPGAEEALEEHLAATENVRGGGQSETANPGSANVTLSAAQSEAQSRTTNRADDQTGMGNIRS